MMHATEYRMVAAVLALCSAPAMAQELPTWSGLWIVEGQQPEISGFAVNSSDQDPLPLAGFSAPWNEAGQVRFFDMVSKVPGRKADGWGYPMMMNSSAPLQFLITSGETLIINIYRDVRHIYTDGRSLPAAEDRWPVVWGESVGHWEGDTLVLETVSVKHPPDYMLIAPPLSEEARYVERIRMTAPDRIENQFTITDPVTLKAPWTITVVYRPAVGMDRLIHEIYENDRSSLEDGFWTIEDLPE